MQLKPPSAPVRDYTLNQALKTWQWWALWLLLFHQCRRGHLHYFSGIADVSGARTPYSACRGHPGRNRLYRQRIWAGVLGVALRFSDAPHRFRAHVRGAGGVCSGFFRHFIQRPS